MTVPMRRRAALAVPARFRATLAVPLRVRAALAVLGAVATVVAAAPAHALEPLRIEALFRRPAQTQFQLAPDGSRLAFLMPVHDRANVALLDLRDMTAKAVTELQDVDVASYEWIGNDRLRVAQADLADAAQDVGIRRTETLRTDGTEGREVPGTILRRLFDDDGTLLVTLPGRARASPDVYQWNPRTGQRKLLTADNPGQVVRWVADGKGEVRAALAREPKTQKDTLYWRAQGEGPWRTLGSWGAAEPGIEPLAFDADDRTLLVYMRGTADKAGLYRYDPEQAKPGALVHAGPRMEADALLFDPAPRKLVGLDLADGSRAWVDPAFRAIQAGIDKALPGTRNLLSWGARSADRILVSAQFDGRQPVHYLLDRKSHNLERVGAASEGLDPAQHSPRRAITYTARDGLKIGAMLTVPKDSGGKNLPLVVEVHGGPFAPGYGPGFDAHAQFLASRGYAVLQPNYRGTTGFGRRLEEAGYRQWGLAMQDDLADAARWAVAQGIADPGRVCLMGGSYGGYATLMGLAKEPKLFRCGVAWVPVTDLEQLFEPAWDDWARGAEGAAAWRKRRIGDLATAREALRAVSPVHLADKIEAPVLLAFGLADPRVTPAQGAAFRAALEAAGRKPDWVAFRDEGHGFHAEANRFAFYRRVEAFLAAQLGGRVQAGAPVRP